MSAKKYTAQQEELARIGKALAHPARIAILQMLANESHCYHGDMSEMLPLAKSTLSQHLNELKNAELIEGNITPPLVRYCIHRQNWAKVQSLFTSFVEEIATIKPCGQ